MQPSSRTPEGEPNRCHVCGHDITIEPSTPPGDAPCPHCNSLLWFDATRRPAAEPFHIQEAKQTIRDLASEIAGLLEAALDEVAFYERFTKLLVQALLAKGGAVWKVENKRPWLPWRSERKSLSLVCQLNLPDRLLDSSREARNHKRLLESVLRSPGELVVPPVSAATGKLRGANPTGQLLLIQPLGNPPELWGVLEVFCRPIENPATQRGYQQFVTSMCEFEANYRERLTAGLCT